MKTESTPFRSEVEPLRCQFEAWRQTRKHGEHIPESLWEAAAKLAGAFGVGRVWWPQDSTQAATSLDAHQLQLLLWNGDPTSGNTAPMWRRIAQAA